MKTARSLLIGIAASAILAGGAYSAELTNPLANYYGGTGFEGFYAGVLLGGFFDGTSAYLTAPDTNAVSLGGAVGVNFYITDSVLGGFEVQGSAEFGASATTYDALALARLGFAPTDQFLLYGAGGGGSANGTGVYAFGGGVEMAAYDSVGVRGELLALGPWGSSPNAIKGTVGLLWHMQ